MSMLYGLTRMFGKHSIKDDLTRVRNDIHRARYLVNEAKDKENWEPHISELHTKLTDAKEKLAAVSTSWKHIHTEIEQLRKWEGYPEHADHHNIDAMLENLTREIAVALEKVDNKGAPKLTPFTVLVFNSTSRAAQEIDAIINTHDKFLEFYEDMVRRA